MKYELRLAHLYGDLLNTYSDIGNILVMKYYAKQMDTNIDVQLISLDDTFNADDFDIALFGGGQDFEQTIVSKDLPNKHDEIQKFIEEGKPLLAICGGYQMLGQYYVGADGKKIPGLGVLSHRTETQKDNRFIGDITIKNEETGEEYHGFENHSGVTFLGENERPLGKVLKGNGNNGQDGSEGAIYKNTFGTYFHGPILARNGNLAKRLLLTALKHKYPNVDFSKQEALEIKPTY
ncbi:MAG TPA: glutamine amidotransferase [Candidatus Ligilactobacillus excrementigallinarum]|uniref:Lipid II isoglutaminyl synthase (glutamine-hydrolyzing) subunit GatD n=1 Tax=Candidatus Ligilactobacillus excrementigallinarum TaxID=2838641 RepID=A0A9D1UVX1_9LACO|nr:glutamine amidotransferase [Candidatus Ligilactobacillus excrementigallinarum]